MFKDKVSQLLRQPMTRREFLRNVGLMLLALVGINAIINILSGGYRDMNNHTTLRTNHGYSSGRYGP